MGFAGGETDMAIKSLSFLHSMAGSRSPPRAPGRLPQKLLKIYRIWGMVTAKGSR